MGIKGTAHPSASQPLSLASVISHSGSLYHCLPLFFLPFLLFFRIFPPLSLLPSLAASTLSSSTRASHIRVSPSEFAQGRLEVVAVQTELKHEVRLSRLSQSGDAGLW